MNKVTFKRNLIVQNGQTVGLMDCGGGMVWISLYTFSEGQGKIEVVARFKYFKPKMTAKKWAKFVLERFTTDAIVAGSRADSPVGFAQSHGYSSSYN